MESNEILCNDCFLDCNVVDKGFLRTNISMICPVINKFYVVFDIASNETPLQLVYEFKYSKNLMVGNYLAELMGKHFLSFMKNEEENHSYDYIIPVPLHPKKLKKRGFNQSVVLAEKISNHSGIKLIDWEISRTKNYKTLTKTDLVLRWQKSETFFELNDKLLLKGKKIFLVDDVLTSGSTVLAISQLLEKKGVQSVNIYTLCAQMPI